MCYETDKRKWRKKEADTDSLFKILWTAFLTFKLLLKKTRHVLPLQTLFPSKNIFTAEAPHCPACLLIFKTSAHLNADHQILTFRGLSSNFQSHKVFVGHHSKRYDARCHFSRGHPFWFWTFNSLQICGHFGLKNDCWESSDSELRERRIPLQRYPGDSQKWAKSPKKERGSESWR